METKEFKRVSVGFLTDLLIGIEKPTFCYVETETDFRMNKTGNEYFGRVKKITKRNYTIGNDYEQRVNNNMEKEGMERTFESLKPSGKHHISKCVLVDDKTESVNYVMLEYFTNVKPIEVILTLDGVELRTDTTDPIVNFNMKELVKKIESFKVKSNSGSGRQEQDKEVCVMTPKIENVKKISINGERYMI